MRSSRSFLRLRPTRISLPRVALALSSFSLFGTAACSSTSSPGSTSEEGGGTGDAAIGLPSGYDAAVTPDSALAIDSASGVEGGIQVAQDGGAIDATQTDATQTDAAQSDAAQNDATQNDAAGSDATMSDAAGTGDSAAEATSPEAAVDGGNSMPPGDIAAAAATPLVAAHSMTRALYAAYDGNLFQVRRASDGKTQDIGVATAGGYVDMTTLTTFCATTTCSVSMLYDQSGNANNLPQATAANQPTVAFWMTSTNTQVPMAVTTNAQWLRNRANTHKIPTGSASQTEIMVVHAHYFNDGCCYDYGNMENPPGNSGPGTMNALYFGNSQGWTWGAGNGPWGMVDMEDGLFAGGGNIVEPVQLTGDPSLAYGGNNIATILSKTNGTSTFVIKVGNAATGALTTAWSGALPGNNTNPAAETQHYAPLEMQGGLSLGEGGDGSNAGTGAFSEGVIIADETTDATDNLIQANLNSVYGM
jgi:non-reducing end alpha-L-arabinofuranosidase